MAILRCFNQAGLCTHNMLGLEAVTHFGACCEWVCLRVLQLLSHLLVQVLRKRQHNHLQDMFSIESSSAPKGILERLGLVWPSY